jgi:hypothetical protein
MCHKPVPNQSQRHPLLNTLAHLRHLNPRFTLRHLTASTTSGVADHILLVLDCYDLPSPDNP